MEKLAMMKGTAMNSRVLFAGAVCVIFLFLCSAPAPAAAYQSVYTNQSLSGFDVNPECNPDGNTPCFDNCTDDDIAISDNGTFGTVTANIHKELIWVNAIGGTRFADSFPEGTPISLGTYKYSCQVRLPVMPDKAQADSIIPEGVHLVMFLWDGDEELFASNRESLEAGLFWQVNPWHEGLDSYGRVKVYTGFDPIVPIETNIRLEPDTEWHTFEVVADFEQQKYVSLTVDGVTDDLSGVDVARVDRSGWGWDLEFMVTTESLPLWPTEDCTGAYTWTTQFRTIEIYAPAEPGSSTTSSSSPSSSSTTAALMSSSTTAITDSTTTVQEETETTTAPPVSSTTSAGGTITTTSAPDSDASSTTTAVYPVSTSSPDIATSTVIPAGTTTTPALTSAVTSAPDNAATSSIAANDTTTTTAPDGPCPAETVYGRDAPETELLRRFRDRILCRSPLGLKLIGRYYRCGTLISGAVSTNETIRKILKKLLDPVIPLVRTMLSRSGTGRLIRDSH